MIEAEKGVSLLSITSCTCKIYGKIVLDIPEKETMQETLSLARHILDEHYKHYSKEKIDYTEMIRELKFILEGIRNYLTEKKAQKKEIKAVLDGLKKYAKEKYMKLYIGNIDDDEGMIDKEKVEEASCYFDYVLKHGGGILNIKDIAVETGIKDLAEHHNHYLYGVPK